MTALSGARARAGARGVAVLAAAAAAAALAACSTQRFPGPMRAAVRPLPPGDVPTMPPGPQEVIVFRHSDPVTIRRSGAPAGFPLPFYAKRERVKSGAWVLCAAGGRAELIWPEDASDVVLFDESVAVIGEPSRDEPMVELRKLTRARMVLTPEDRVELMGGAVLRGDALETTGPVLVERRRDDVLRVVNQSKLTCSVAFRDEDLALSPGAYVDLPLLAAGGAPLVRDPDERPLEAAGLSLAVAGEVDVAAAGPDGVRLVAREEATVRGLGVTVRLRPGEAAVLGVPAPAGPDGPTTVPVPEEVAPAGQVPPERMEPLDPPGTGTDPPEGAGSPPDRPM